MALVGEEVKARSGKQRGRREIWKRRKEQGVIKKEKTVEGRRNGGKGKGRGAVGADKEEGRGHPV